MAVLRLRDLKPTFKKDDEENDGEEDKWLFCRSRVLGQRGAVPVADHLAACSAVAQISVALSEAAPQNAPDMQITRKTPMRYLFLRL
ncbi:hypothetical protein AK812_SmicGene26015 [Symbiodinium microadriaticum]|uniref:Uncharacterized protein n=1 Tax=Symbiodinium microadriaticum TaxID=2951 RepID=A0A1Q9DAN1_SYMMI|nr:hypothetical protein AK812_SmicGene26015 [Symbiodinium microadriaticum]